MAPVDQVGQMMTVSGPMGHGPLQPQQPGSRSIPLSTLIEYIIQRTYHELSVLSELLPRKTDMERKIEIVQFASRTRQLFVRLLALVKWANSASKVDKCARMSSFLDEQAMYFVDTADLLARMARETLLHASLPSFSLPCAIDVLTTGTYPRLPACIKEKIVPPDPITREEKEQTLSRLNQIIEHRLVTSDLPRHMRKPTIRNGRVKFTVKHEFEVTLTLMGDGANIPWRLLDIEFLVEDPETGDGKALVHSLQVNYIHQLVQSRLIDGDKALHDLYNCLHSFCQSLQLEVLHSQTQRLIQQRLRDHIRIEDYSAGKCLVISYWREPFRRENKPFSPVYKLNIHVDEQEPDKPLQLSHFPQIQGSENTRVAQAIKSDHLSLEKLLVHTVQIRSVAKLKDLEREFRLIAPAPCEIRDLPTVLYVPVVNPSMETESLCITVNIITGNFMTSVNGRTSDTTSDIEDCINGDRKGLRKHLTSLRMWLALERCKRSIQHLQVPCLSYLPLVNLSLHPLETMGPHKLFLKLPKEQNSYLVVRVDENKRRVVDFRYYLLQCQPSSLEEEPLAPPPPSLSSGEPQSDTPKPKVFLKAVTFIELDKWTSTRGPCSRLFEPEAEQPSPLSRKRKLLLGESCEADESIAKKPRGSPYFLPELIHILSMCEDRMPFAILATQLEKFGLYHQGVRVEGEGAGLTLSLVKAPPCSSINKDTALRLQKDLLSCKFRIQRKGSRIWLVECLFANCPLQSTNSREQGPVHCLYFTYDLSSSDAISKVVESFLDDWTAVAHLYQAALDFSQAIQETNQFQGAVEIKSFTYKRLTLAYGLNKSYTASIQYLTITQQFHVTLGSCGAASVANCHTLLLTHLQNDLNTTGSLAQLTQILVETWSLMSSVGKLNLAPQLALSTKVTQPSPNFTLVPQSSTHLRLIFRSLYCLDLHCRAGRLVAIRDGAYSMYDTSKVVGGLTPTPGLVAFLNLFVDETVSSKHTRRRSVTEDDNPPSPVGMDTMDNFMSSLPSTGGSSRGPGGGTRGGDGGYRFPMTPPSNPHTPASPSGGRLGQPHPSPSHVGASFPLASPPSLQHIIAPSPSNVMAPSPGAPNPSPSAFMPPPSPSSLGIHMSPATQFISPQGMIDGSGSPFPVNSGGGGGGGASLTMPSPRAGGAWPPSPSVQSGGPSSAPRYIAPSPSLPPDLHLLSPQKDLDRLCASSASVLSPPSRILPQKSWAASIPTLLSHDALNKLLSPGPPPGASVTSLQSTGPLTCPLERFLCCSYLLRHLKRIIPSTENLSQVVCNEPGVVIFKGETLQLRVQLNPVTLQSLHLIATPNKDLPSSNWDSEEIQVLEKFFEAKVVSGLYKANTLHSFGRLMGAPLRILKDFVQIMRLEMMPEPNMKWGVQWCLTMPHNMVNVTFPGSPAIVIKSKVFFILQLTPTTGGEAIQVPILYEMTNNQTQMMEQQSVPPTPASIAISTMFKRFSEFNQKPADCTIYPAIRELLSNLTVNQPMTQPGQQQQQQQPMSM